MQNEKRLILALIFLLLIRSRAGLFTSLQRERARSPSQGKAGLSRQESFQSSSCHSLPGFWFQVSGFKFLVGFLLETDTGNQKLETGNRKPETQDP